MRRIVARGERGPSYLLAPWLHRMPALILAGAVGLLSVDAREQVAYAENGRVPNIVLILVDDLGWMDLGCQGNKLIDTPNVDRLALQGMRFTDAYSAAPVCSPTRAAILTGQSPARLHLTTHIPDRPQFTPEAAKLLSAKTLDHLPLAHVTIAERLKAAGYATAFLGKWHLCGRGGAGNPEFYPQRQGFDVNLGGCALGGPPTYFDPYRIPGLPAPRRIPARPAGRRGGDVHAGQPRGAVSSLPLALHGALADGGTATSA